MSGRTAVKHEEYVESMAAERYILGELPAAERDGFEEHYFECPECADAVRNLSHVRDATRAGLCTPPEPASSRQSAGGWFRRWQAWLFQPQTAVTFAALAIAAVTSYQNVQLKSQLEPQALRSITLQPASRGDAATIDARAAGNFVLLEADLPGASGKLIWSLRSADGKLASTGTGVAPDAGLLFRVLVPAKQLTAPAYHLQVRSDSGREWLFRFRADAR
jgi:anti-sigma factor RsiW